MTKNTFKLIVLFIILSVFSGCSNTNEKLEKIRADIVELYGPLDIQFDQEEIEIYNKVKCDGIENTGNLEHKLVYILVGERNFEITPGKYDSILKDNMDELMDMVFSIKYSSELSQKAGQNAVLLLPVDKLLLVLENKNIDLSVMILGLHRLIHDSRLNNKEEVIDFLKKLYDKRNNVGLKLVLSYRLLQLGHKNNLCFFIKHLWISEYFSPEAIGENNWGKDINKIPDIPSIPLNTYKDYNTFLKKYTNKTFKTAGQWQDWYDKNKGNICWDGKAKQYKVK